MDSECTLPLCMRKPRIDEPTAKKLRLRAESLAVKSREGAGSSYIDEAIVIDRGALELCPAGHPERYTSLTLLAIHLGDRYDQLGETRDLEEAIVLAQTALDICEQGHPHRGFSSNNLGISLYTRYSQAGFMENLNAAIVLHREALELRPQGRPDRLTSLNNLALCLSTRYKQLGVTEDLDGAIVLAQEALDLCPRGHPSRFMVLKNLADCLYTRHNQFGVTADLEAAIVQYQEVVSLFPRQQPEFVTSLKSLGTCVSTCYYQLGVAEVLDASITLYRKALGLRPQGHTSRPTSLDDLARCLCMRFSWSMESKDIEVFNLYAQLVHATQSSSSNDLSATRTWVSVAEDLQRPMLLLAYETSLRLLVQYLAILPSRLPRRLDILKNLTSSLAVDAFSACVHNRFHDKAIELLEQGRGIFWSQLTRLRSSLDDLVTSGAAGKALANDFVRLSSLIHDALDSLSPEQRERLYHLNLELQRAVNNIRELPGLSRFLIPSLYSGLHRSAASEGPVIVVNASKYSCDALIVLLDRDPVRISLQITQQCVRDLSMELRSLTKRAKRANVTRHLAFFLRKLWDQVVSFIVDFLQMSLPRGSRIWWCPTAEFSLLPLHAAGPYRKGELNLPDLYISSYTPTLSALIRARRHDPSNAATQLKRCVCIGQSRASGENELLSVGTELDTICQRVDGLATFTRIEGEESCISRVVEELKKNEWVHFACHGLPNRTQLFDSAFALHDGHFTIDRIIGCELKNPEFAYLSACHTTVGDEESPDEVVHLASAIQFAGFRSVIGTMWAVDDGQTNKITSTFYKHMVDEAGHLDHTRAALALNKTMKSVNIPFDQRVLYVHIGA